MFTKFIYLEWKSFTRSASFASNLALKILMGFLVLYFTLLFLALGVGAFYILREMKLDPLVTINKFLIYYFLIDLIIRLLLQAIPVLNIRPLLTLNFKRPTIVHFSLGKTLLSFFNIVHAFLFLPFCAVLIYEGYDVISVLLWMIALFSLVFTNNFLNILLNNKDNLLRVFIAIVLILAGCQYFKLFDITNYTHPFFETLFHTKWLFILPVFVLAGLYYWTYNYLKGDLYLDAGLSIKNDIAKTENLNFLNQFGTLGTFLKNDIKLILSNKRSKTTIGLSVMFLFYGLLFFSSGIEVYDKPMIKIFAGIFVSGGFLITFGQFVPSWDSAYYQLMMTQNIPYKGYLNSKWWLMIIGTVISTILASFYLFFGWHVYLIILVGAIYNIGFNSLLVLLGGAFTKTPIDLNSGKGAFGDKKAFNIKTMLITIPQLILPMALYWLGTYLMNANLGLAFVGIFGVTGLALKNKAFVFIEKIYKKEKYKTIEAYKQKG